MISAEKISRRFGAAAVLHDVSFTAPSGEVVGLLGPNGAGKTTTIRILTGLLDPSGGTVRIDGIRLDEDPRAVKRRIGYLPENNPLYLDMKVAAYLDFAAEAKGVPKRRRSSSVAEAIETCGLAGHEKRTIGKLSKGFRQRVGIAQAVVNDPSVIILDEPTTGLDPAQIVEFRNLIRLLKQDRTILLSTHILSDASAVCDRLVILRKGRVVAEGSTEALGRRIKPVTEWALAVEGPRASVDAAFGGLQGILRVDVGAGKAPNRWEIRAFTENDADPRRAFLATIVAYDLKLLELLPAKVDIEEIFLELAVRRDV